MDNQKDKPISQLKNPRAGSSVSTPENIPYNEKAKATKPITNAKKPIEFIF
jgi:hypothetical protein